MTFVSKNHGKRFKNLLFALAFCCEETLQHVCRKHKSTVTIVRHSAKGLVLHVSSMSRSVSRCTSTSKNGTYYNGEGNAVVSPRRSWTRRICARWVVMCASVCLATVLLLGRHPWHIGQLVLGTIKWSLTQTVVCQVSPIFAIVITVGQIVQWDSTRSLHVLLLSGAIASVSARRFDF